MTISVLLGVAVVLAGCGEDQKSVANADEDAARPAGTAQSRARGDADPGTTAAGTGSRWFDAESVERGAVVFAEHCAACHGKGGEGAFAWRKRGADGKFPPPPLDGTGHAWHHPIRALGSQIKFGAPGGTGNMPPFSAILSDQDVLNVIAWFQSKWPDEIYAAWFDIELRSRTPDQ